MKLSLVIRCLNEEKHIGKLLAGVMEQTVKDIEVVIVDSGSTDATLSIASRFPVKIVNIKPEDFSFGYALNVGCEAASGDVLLFASAHVYPVFNDWLEKILQPFEDEQVALVYGQQRGEQGRNKYSEHQVFKQWFPEESTLNQKHPFCNNANCAIRKSLWAEQPYDETLTGLEDLDWAKKILEKDYKIAYQAEAAIIHVHEEKWSQVYNRYRREAIAFRLINKNESFNIFTFITLLLQNWKNDFRQALKEGVFLKEFISIIRFRWNQYYGTYRGFKQSYLMDNKVRERFYYPKGFFDERKKEEERINRKIDYTKIEK